MNSELMERWMQMVGFKITEGQEYSWQCFGDSAYTLTHWDQDIDGKSFNITFDTRDHVVYMLEAHDFKNRRAYRWFAPTYQEAYKDEVRNRDSTDEAWEDVKYVDLELLDDWFEKATAICNSEAYDERVKVPIDFTDEELLKYMKLAHEQDITFNQFVEEALKAAIDDYNRDPEGFEKRAKDFQRG